jgi:acetolactate synthase-1/2/3 large subunit
MAIDRLMLEALQRSDLLVGLGLDPVELDKTWHADAPIVWLLQSLGATGAYPSSAVLPGRHRPVLECLLAEDPPREWEGSFDDVRERRRQIAQGKGSARLPGVSPLSIVRVLAAALPSETIVTTDVGSHKYIFGQFWPSRHPDTFWMSNGLSGMGYGLPASIGAKLARPDQPVLAVLGDGGFSMNSQELETAKRLGANIVVVVLADRSYSLIKLAQEARGLPSLAVDFERIDAVATASACGVRALRAENQAELAEAAREAQSSEDSLVIEVSVDPHSYKGLV